MANLGPDKHLKGAVYGNPYQAQFAENGYTQNVDPPNVKGGGPAYKNPYDAITQHFFEPMTPNDSAFSDMEAAYEVSSADPVGQIMADFKAAQARMQQ